MGEIAQKCVEQDGGCGCGRQRDGQWWTSSQASAGSLASSLRMPLSGLLSIGSRARRNEDESRTDGAGTVDAGVDAALAHGQAEITRSTELAGTYLRGHRRPKSAHFDPLLLAGRTGTAAARLDWTHHLPLPPPAASCLAAHSTASLLPDLSCQFSPSILKQHLDRTGGISTHSLIIQYRSGQAAMLTACPNATYRSLSRSAVKNEATRK